MSKRLAALQKQAAAIQAQIIEAELAEKNKNRTERLTLKLLQKYPDLYLCDPVVVEKAIDEAFSLISTNLKIKPEIKPEIKTE